MKASHVIVSTIIGQLINSDNIFVTMSQQTVIQWIASEMNGKGNYMWWSISCTVSEWLHGHTVGILETEFILKDEKSNIFLNYVF